MSGTKLSLFLNKKTILKKILTFGEYIRFLREKSGFPLRKIAEQLDIDPSLLGKIERDKRMPTKTQIKKLAQIFNENESILVKEHLSDQIAYKILDEESSSEILKIAEEKARYFKATKKVGYEGRC